MNGEKTNHPRADLSKPGLFLKTFGCQMNVYDSEKIAWMLRQDFQLVDSLENASLVILNTCSVRDKAEHKLYSLLGRVREFKEQHPGVVIGVGGCLAQQEGEALIKRCREIDFVVGTHNLSLLPSLVHNAKRGMERQVAVDFRDEWDNLPDEFLPVSEGEHVNDPNAGTESPSEQDLQSNLQQANLNSEVRALVAIQRGCNKHCSFCVVPTTRGEEVSRSEHEILREVNYKVKAGAREILLLGQTVNSYGRDRNGSISFANLVEKVAQIPGVTRIRFTSPHPQDVREDFIDLYGRIPQLVPHIHLPLQSGSDRVLRAMNRNYRIRRYLEIVDALRNRCPDIAITTDIIVGFPTETAEEFENTLDVMSQVNYSHSFAFKYSRRPNTSASSSYNEKDEIDEALKEERLKRVLDLQEQLSTRFNRNAIGTEVEVLIESISDRKGTTANSFCAKGRIPQNTLIEIRKSNQVEVGLPSLKCLSFEQSNTPHIGTKLFAEQSRLTYDCKVGDLVRVKVENCGPYGLRGFLIDCR